MFRDDPHGDVWDSQFFSEYPHRNFRLTTAADTDTFGTAAEMGYVWLRLCRFAWCKDYRDNRRCASLVKQVPVAEVPHINASTDPELASLWITWLAWGVMPEVGPILPSGLISRRGKGWFDPPPEKETTSATD